MSDSTSIAYQLLMVVYSLDLCFGEIMSRQFSVDEADRYAGSRGEPARMASNFAGVQRAADDSRNDIVIRGNSPQGVLWRLEGVSIPNPNHFAIAGISGGPVSIINNLSWSILTFLGARSPQSLAIQLRAFLI